MQYLKPHSLLTCLGLCTLLVFSSFSSAFAHADPSEHGAKKMAAVVDKDTTWSGNINIDGNTTVPAGVTLNITPGTTVRFAYNSGLYVFGKIISRGTADKPITYTAQNLRKPGGWAMVELQTSAVGEFFHCIVEYAEWGLHEDFSTMTVSNCLLRNNQGGMKFMGGLVEVTDSVFINNEIGIRWRQANGKLENNLITKNEIGTFIKEGDGKLLVANNNIVDNKKYNMRVGDFVETDIDAQNNWWGPGNPLDKIYDGRKEPKLGKVIFEPYLKEPVKAAPAAATAKPIVPETIPGITNVDASDVKKAISRGAFVYDVRPERAVKKGTIPETENLVYDSKSKKAIDFDPAKDSFDLEVLPKDKEAEVVFYCNGETCWRSYKAALAAQKAGYKNIKWFRGGVPEWKVIGEPIKKSK